MSHFRYQVPLPSNQVQFPFPLSFTPSIHLIFFRTSNIEPTSMTSSIPISSPFRSPQLNFNLLSITLSVHPSLSQHQYRVPFRSHQANTILSCTQTIKSLFFHPISIYSPLLYLSPSFFHLYHRDLFFFSLQS